MCEYCINVWISHCIKSNSACLFSSALLIGAAQIRKNICIPILKKSEVRYRHPYQARHTFATMLISEGRNLWWIADQMGHDGPEMLFRHYGNYIKEHDHNKK
ncbi:tyrosine-type recombinase/integrase [Pseudoalteromonas sp. A25]|uniref:tyrosine-type recombinase/integrase n=1 Tax=Pseudoalteromonas sp. A25 TaxID=116092 RepID=UPI001261356B